MNVDIRRPMLSTLFLSVLLAHFLLFCSSRVEAVPASPSLAEITQPDGTRFKLRLNGDDFFSWNETEDGYVVEKDSADGFWKYAVPRADSTEFEILKDARVGTARPEQLNLTRHDIPERELIKDRIYETRPDLMQRLDSTQLSSPPPMKIPVSGTTSINNVVILAAFSDHWDGGNNTVLSSKGRTNTTEYQNLFNELNHSADGAVGSVKDYYKEVSYTKLTINSIIVGWVQLPQNESYYGANFGGNDVNRPQMVSDAIQAAENAGFDFSQSDSDGDGWVDCLTIIHSGHGEELSGNSTDSIWSHQWSLVSAITYDGVNMSMYHTEPALRGPDGTSQAASTSIIRIGVVAHEMGHFLGLPDLYDFSNTTEGIGMWGVMSGGSWGGGDGKQPSHFCAWSKTMLGFAAPTEVHSGNTVQLPRVEVNPIVHMIRDGMINGEYFLLENRASYGFDSGLPEGILIWHIDSKSFNNDLGTWTHNVVRLEEADGGNTLGSSGSANATHPWRDDNGLAGGFRDTTADPETNAMMYQDGHYCQRNDSASDYSYIRISNFSAPGATMTYDLQTLTSTVAGKTVTTADYTVNWVSSSEAAQYEIEEGTPVTLTSFFDGAEDEDLFYENWYLGGTARRSDDGANTGSYSFMLSTLDSAANWLYSVQSFTMKKQFKVKSNTTISFYYLAHIQPPNAYMKIQLSNDGGDTWNTVDTISSYTLPLGSWASASYDFTDISSAGISENDMCIARMIMDRQYAFGYNEYPWFGYAFDDFQIENTEISDYGNWSTLSDTEVGTSYDITGKTNGTYAYRVRAYANSSWQKFSPAAEVVVSEPKAMPWIPLLLLDD